MIFGNYPCCNGELCLSMPEKTPTSAPENCPHCGKRVWHIFSRLEPMSYTEKDFLKSYEVDEITKAVTKRSAA